MKRENILKTKSYEFAIKIVSLYKNLTEQKKEYIISKQVLRSGTAIGALIREAEFAQSRKDLISKLSISLKEANETTFRLDLLRDTNYLQQKQYNTIDFEIKELIKMLVSSVKTSKMKLN